MSLYNYLTRDHMDKAEKVTDRYQMSTWKKGYLHTPEIPRTFTRLYQ